MLTLRVLVPKKTGLFSRKDLPLKSKLKWLLTLPL